MNRIPRLGSKRTLKLLMTLVLIGIPLFPTVLRGQVVQSWGFKAGMTSSSISGFEFGNVDRRTGISAFVFAEWLNSPLISLVTEVGYAQRGFEEGPHEGRDEQNLPTGEVMIVTRFDYLSSAFLVKLTPVRSQPAPYVVLGPRIDVYLGGETDSGSLPSFHLEDEYAKLALGGTGGAGLRSRIGRSFTLFVEARVNIDATNSLPDSAADARNHSIDLLIGIVL